jgi:ATP-dependent exoDNAse (exonuclease V) beta subunit
MMSAFEPNPQQQRAVETLKGDLVVSAGAGSGKTTVLARRFAHAVSPDGSGLEADMGDILTITFTRKAAAELIERVRRVLIEAGPEGVDYARRVDEAWVSTIDSLCARLVRRHVLEIGADPDTRYAGDVKTAQLRRSAAQQAIAEWAVAHPGSDVLGYGTVALRDSLTRDLEKLRSMGCDPRQLAPCATAEPEGSLGEAGRACQGLVCAIEGLDAPMNASREANLESARRVAQACADADIQVSGAAERLLGQLLGVKITTNANPREEAREAKAALAQAVAALSDKVLAPLAAGYTALLSRYASIYQSAKETAGLMDFGDAVEGVASLFEERPDLAEAYRERFKLVMIDEFQDTNELQMAAIAPLVNDNLCVVGDVQQSIYGFRYADVDVMRDLAAEVDRTMPLTLNYRTHPDVLDVVNHVFAQPDLMGDAYVALEAARTKEYGVPWPADAPRVEVHCLDETLCETGTHPAQEAEIVAERVGRLIDEGARPQEIAILLRGMTHAPTIAAALSDRGIAAHLASGEAFFETPEIADVRALLRAVAVPDDDAALVGVLAGPMCGLSDETLLAASNARQPGESLWRGLRALADYKETSDQSVRAAAAIRERIEYLSEVRGDMGLADFIHHAVHLFDYDLTLLASGHRGPQAWSNVGKLIRIATDFERATHGDVCAFLDYLEDYEELVGKEPVAPAAVANDAVRIMSVHAAKGLEFPVVILPQLGRGLASATDERLLVERDTDGRPRIGLRWPADGSSLEDTRDSNYETLREVRKLAEVAEEKRILYVAMTRAEEALVLVGRGHPDKHRDTPIGLVATALGIEPGGSSTGSEAPRVGVHWHGPCAVGEKADSDSTSEAPSPAALCSMDQLAEPTSSPAQPVVPGVVPSHLSYSALHTFDQCPYRFYARYVLGLVGPRGEDGGALELGRVVHLALQDADPRAAVSRLARRERLTSQQATRAHGAVEAFVDSDISRRLSAADRVHTERPFAVDLGPTRLQGQIDALGYEGDTAVIIDYKTGEDVQISSTPERQRGYELQAACYALPVLEEGARKVEVYFVFVEQECRVVSFAHDQQDAAGIRDGIGDRITVMESGDLPRLDEADPQLCPGCPAVGLCPLSCLPHVV